LVTRVLGANFKQVCWLQVFDTLSSQGLVSEVYKVLENHRRHHAKSRRTLLYCTWRVVTVGKANNKNKIIKLVMSN